MAAGRGPCSDANWDKKRPNVELLYQSIKTMAMDLTKNYNERTEKVLYV
jgi:hypothetical protein